MSLLTWLGLAPSEQDQKLKQLVDNTYNSVRVVGRGTVKIDPKEVSSTEAFKQARKRARDIVRA